MPHAFDRFYKGQPGTSTAVLATVPASTKWIIKQITICNTTASSATLTFGITGTSADDRILDAYPVDPHETVTVDLTTVAQASETLDAFQGTSAALTVFISGVVVT